MIHKSKKVVFDLDDGMMDSNGNISIGSYIEDKHTGKKTFMDEKDGNFVVKMKVIPYKYVRPGQAEQLAPLAQAPATEGGSSSSQAVAMDDGTAPFRRRVPWP